MRKFAASNLLKQETSCKLVLLFFAYFFFQIQQEQGFAASYSLVSRSTTIAPGAGLIVDWTATPSSGANDWIGLFKIGTPNSAFDPNRWRYFGGSSGGAIWFLAPDPGIYEFRALAGFTAIAVSQAVTVTGSAAVTNNAAPTNAAVALTYSLTALPATVQAGQNVTISWTALTGGAKDWIGWYKSGTQNTAFDGSRWRYTGGASTGSFSISAPTTAGTYEFRYLVNDGFTSVATSQTVTVTLPTPVTTMTNNNISTASHSLISSPTFVQVGQNLTVNWTAPSGSSTKDWIGWYKSGTQNTAFDGSRWRYTGGASTGSFSISAPTTAGTYEFRYLVNDGYTSVTRSQTVTVAGTNTAATTNVVTSNTSTTSTTFGLQATPATVLGNQNVSVTWVAPTGSATKDWIGWFKVGNPNTAFDSTRWTYTNGATAGTFTVSAPNIAGIYEFRYLLNDGYTTTANSNNVTVSVPATGPTVMLSASPEAISVGMSSLLSWTTANVTSCNASGGWSGIKNLSGTQIVIPNTTTTYTLSCTGSLGNSSTSITVNVNTNSTENQFYVAKNGNDNNPGTIAAPFASLRKGVSVLRPGDTLIIRAGEYDTVNGLTTDGTNSAIPSGLSWNQPVTIKAYPGENVVFRRYLPNGSANEDVVARSIHFPTQQECLAWAQSRWGSAWQTYYKSYPYDCWTGSGSANDGLYYQAPYGFVGGAVLTMWNGETRPVQYIVFDGIDFDAKGITQNAVTFDAGAKHIRFINGKIHHSIGSCVTQPSVSDPTIKTYLQFIRMKIFYCGVPYDYPARKSIHARFFHPWYFKTGGNLIEDSEVYESAGTGLGPDGSDNVIRGNYIHSNSGQGIFISGGDNWVIEYNVFRNNGGPGIYHQNGRNHVIRHNTIVLDSEAYNSTSYGILLATGAWSTTYENNIVTGFPYGIWNNSTSSSPNRFVNNLIQSATANREFTTSSGSMPMILQSNILGLDPKFVGLGDFRLQSISPALGTATDGGNIGAK